MDGLKKALSNYPGEFTLVNGVLGLGDTVLRHIEPRVTIASDVTEWLPEPVQDDKADLVEETLEQDTLNLNLSNESLPDEEPIPF